jgi:hypothetical protein
VALAPKTALDELAKAKLHGSLRDACVVVLGGAFIGVSAGFRPPQSYAFFIFGVLMALTGVIFLGLRMYRSYLTNIEQ